MQPSDSIRGKVLPSRLLVSKSTSNRRARKLGARDIVPKLPGRRKKKVLGPGNTLQPLQPTQLEIPDYRHNPTIRFAANIRPRWQQTASTQVFLMHKHFLSWGHLALAATATIFFLGADVSAQDHSRKSTAPFLDALPQSAAGRAEVGAEEHCCGPD